MPVPLINNYIYTTLPNRFPLRNNSRYLNDKEISELRGAEQVFSDCYLTAGLDALTRSPNGRLILKNNIIKNDQNPDIITYSLYTPNGTRDNFTINLKNLPPEYNKLKDAQRCKTIQGTDISLIEFEKKYKTKPLICKAGTIFKTYKFENFMPSLFLKMITGKTPVVIAENNLNVNLSGHREEVLKLFEKMAGEKDFSFVIMNGLKGYNNRRFHVYVIESVNMPDKTITIKNKRGNTSQTISFDTAIKTFKSIAGYFNSDLKQN